VIDDDWDILFAMQHYGTPTRLLDWTEVFGVALYFAIIGIDETKRTDEKGRKIPPPCVWLLNPYRLNSHSTGIRHPDLWSPTMLGWDLKESTYYTYGELLLESGIDFDYPRAIYPRQQNPRLHAQRAWFDCVPTCKYCFEAGLLERRATAAYGLRSSHYVACRA
jgi:hypothetical protein